MEDTGYIGRQKYRGQIDDGKCFRLYVKKDGAVLTYESAPFL